MVRRGSGVSGSFYKICGVALPRDTHTVKYMVWRSPDAHIPYNTRCSEARGRTYHEKPASVAPRGAHTIRDVVLRDRKTDGSVGPRGTHSKICGYAMPAAAHTTKYMDLRDQLAHIL